MRHWLIRSGAAVVLLWGLAGTVAAHAGTVDVKFDLAGSQIVSVALGTIAAAPTGTMTVTFATQSFSMLTIIAGPVHVKTFNLQGGMFIANGLATGQIALAGSSLAGNVTGGGGLAFNGPLLQNGFVHCYATVNTCIGALGFPNSVQVPIGPAPQNLNFAGSMGGLAANAVIGGAGALNPFGQYPLTLVLNASEISRVKVPEPSSLLLLGSGLAALLGVGGLRLRR